MNEHDATNQLRFLYSFGRFQRNIKSGWALVFWGVEQNTCKSCNWCHHIVGQKYLWTHHKFKEFCSYSFLDAENECLIGNQYINSPSTTNRKIAQAVSMRSGIWSLDPKHGLCFCLYPNLHRLPIPYSSMGTQFQLHNGAILNKNGKKRAHKWQANLMRCADSQVNLFL